MPIAFKNSTQGSIQVALNGMITALNSHRRLTIDQKGKIVIENTKGNQDVHISLRGGNKTPNYQSDSIAQTLDALRQQGLPEKVVVDCSHDNSPPPRRRAKGSLL